MEEGGSRKDTDVFFNKVLNKKQKERRMQAPEKILQGFQCFSNKVPSKKLYESRREAPERNLYGFEFF